MNRYLFLGVLPVVICCLLVCAEAKPRHIVGVIVPGTTPRIVVYGVRNWSDCEEKFRPLLLELSMFKRQYPADWTIDVMCTDLVWDELRLIADQKTTNTAFTVIAKKHTFIRGDIFNHMRPAYRQTLAHELGHVLCKCPSEEIADGLADEIQGNKK